MFTVERDGAVAGGPDGPMPVQRGDVVIVYVAKSWSDAARNIPAREESGRPAANLTDRDTK
jgi:hypothetical protein